MDKRLKTLFSHVFGGVSDEPLKYRHELKYICTEGDLRIIESRIKPICRLDPYVNEEGSGSYQIRSVYLDDVDDSCFYENEDGVDRREKYRIRIYNADDSRISLECKSKKRQKTHKESVILTREESDSILKDSFVLKPTGDSLKNKFYLQYSNEFLRPKIIVAYERTPYIYAVGNVRITFDRNIRVSDRIKDFFEPYIPMQPIMPTDQHVLEVKYDELLPDFIYDVMNLGTLQQTTFSKYYLCRNAMCERGGTY